MPPYGTLTSRLLYLRHLYKCRHLLSSQCNRLFNRRQLQRRRHGHKSRPSTNPRSKQLCQPSTNLYLQPHRRPFQRTTHSTSRQLPSQDDQPTIRIRPILRRKLQPTNIYPSLRCLRRQLRHRRRSHPSPTYRRSRQSPTTSRRQNLIRYPRLHHTRKRRRTSLRHRPTRIQQRLRSKLPRRHLRRHPSRYQRQRPSHLHQCLYLQWTQGL